MIYAPPESSVPWTGHFQSMNNVDISAAPWRARQGSRQQVAVLAAPSQNKPEKVSNLIHCQVLLVLYIHEQARKSQCRSQRPTTVLFTIFITSLLPRALCFSNSMAAAAANTPGPFGPVPFKDVDDGSVPNHIPKEEFGELVAALPRRQQSILELRLYQGFWLLEHWVPGTVVFQRRFAPRPDDVVLASYPKCGTTWLKALAFAVAARGAHPPSGAGHPLRRLNPHDCVPFIDEIFAGGEEAKLDLLPSPRLMNTHLPYTLLPEPVTDGGCRVVYICRDPKDMAVSLWHFLRRRQPDLSFADTFESVCNGTVVVGPVWDHVLSYWRASVAHPDRVLFLKYEDLQQDPGSNVRRLAEFTGQPFSAAEEAAGAVAAVVELCSFDKMKGLEVNKAGTLGAYCAMPRDAFFRKGVAGDWANHMTPEMAARLDNIVGEKLRGTGLAFA